MMKRGVFFLLVLAVISTGVVGFGTWGGFDYMNIAFGSRGMYHFNFAAISDNDFIQKLDVYA